MLKEFKNVNVNYEADALVEINGKKYKIHDCIEGEWEFPEGTKCLEEVVATLKCSICNEPMEVSVNKKPHHELTEEQKHDRLNRLNARINEGFLQGRKRFENEIVEVLVDGPSKNNENMMTGYTPHNMLVNFEAPNAKVGDLVNVKIVKAYSWHLLGELVK